MMSKKICKLCINSRRLVTFSDGDKDTHTPMPWDQTDDEAWVKGWVYCPEDERGEFFGGFVVGSEYTMQHCRFRLEHLMAKKRS